MFLKDQNFSIKSIDDLLRCINLASLLEIAGWPKPGNVHRTKNFKDTRFEHFLAGSVAFIPSIRELGLRGSDVCSGLLKWDQIGLGNNILRAMNDSLKWQKGGNVNLGVALLFSPIAVAAGATLQEHNNINVINLREKLESVITNATSDDTLGIYKSINLSMSYETLGNTNNLDVRDERSLDRISAEKIPPLKVFESCANRDLICSEWVTNFKVTFEMGHPRLNSCLKTTDINTAILDTYLYLLAKNPDSLITRKSGAAKARKVSQRALEIIRSGGASSLKGMNMLLSLDEELHRGEGALNPGTTADLTAASIFVSLLEGWRP